TGRVHVVATINAAATRAARQGQFGPAGVRLAPGDLRRSITQGRESNLLLFAVDASGSMAASRRMVEVKTAVLSMLVDAYQRRDRVGVITFRGSAAEVALPPTSSVEAAARCLSDVGHGGRTPLAEGLVMAARVLKAERIRDPRRRALLVVVTDGRATSGRDALVRARAIADQWASTGVQAVVVDCEAGKFRMNLAGDLARRMGAEHIALGEIGASALVDVVRERRVA
ncbi:MAG: VWA domain-containing protein, partial [Ornithinimicrobium sp.]